MGMTQNEIRNLLVPFVQPGIAEFLEQMEFEELRHCWCGTPLQPWLDSFGAYWICPACGCKPVRYRATQASLLYLYRDSGYYWTGYQQAHNCPTVEQRFENDANDRIPLYLSWIRQLVAPPARTLEVGCGPGRLLFETASAGYEAYATEMDDRVGAFAASKALRPVFHGALPPLSEKPFDLIMVIDVFEHVHDPAAFAAEVASRLAPDGQLLLHLPIVDSEEEAYLHSGMFNPLSHLWIHSSLSFRNLWSELSFEVKTIGELFGMPSWALHRKTG